MRATLASAIVVSVLTAGCSILGLGPPKSGSGANEDGSSGQDGDTSTPPLFEGDKPKIPAAYEGLSFGIAKEDAAKISADYVKGGSIGEKRYPGISFFTSWDDDHLSSVWLGLEEPASKRVLERATKAWGEPLQGVYLKDYKLQAWFNEADGVVAFINDGDKLEFWPYLTFEKLLADEAEPFLVPLLGKTIDEVRDLHPSAKWDEESGHVDLLPTAYDQFPGFTRVHYELNGAGKIKEYDYGIGFRRYMPKKEDIRALLEKKYGEAKELKSGHLLLHAKNPKIHISHDDISNAWEVSVNRPYL